MLNDNYQAFVLHIAPSGSDRMQKALRDGQAIIGWANAAQLLDPTLGWDQCREVLRAQYYSADGNLRRAGAAAGHMWRCICEMKPGGSHSGSARLRFLRR